MRGLRTYMIGQGRSPRSAWIIAWVITLGFTLAALPVALIGIMYFSPPDGSSPDPVVGAGLVGLAFLLAAIPQAAPGRHVPMSPAFAGSVVITVILGLVASLIARSAAATLLLFDVAAAALVIREWRVKRTLERVDDGA